MNKKAAVYIRYNKPAEDIRLEEFLNYAKENELDLYKIYIDLCSGLEPNPPKLKNLIKEAKNFDKLLVYRFDRISRNVKLFHEIKDELAKSNVKIYSLKERLTV